MFGHYEHADIQSLSLKYDYENKQQKSTLFVLPDALQIAPNIFHIGDVGERI